MDRDTNGQPLSKDYFLEVFEFCLFSVFELCSLLQTTAQINKLFFLIFNSTRLFLGILHNDFVPTSISIYLLEKPT